MLKTLLVFLLSGMQNEDKIAQTNSSCDVKAPFRKCVFTVGSLSFPLIFHFGERRVHAMGTQATRQTLVLAVMLSMPK